MQLGDSQPLDPAVLFPVGIENPLSRKGLRKCGDGRLIDALVRPEALFNMDHQRISDALPDAERNHFSVQPDTARRHLKALIAGEQLFRAEAFLPLERVHRPRFLPIGGEHFPHRGEIPCRKRAENRFRIEAPELVEVIPLSGQLFPAKILHVFRRVEIIAPVAVVIDGEKGISAGKFGDGGVIQIGEHERPRGLSVRLGRAERALPVRPDRAEKRVPIRIRRLLHQQRIVCNRIIHAVCLPPHKPHPRRVIAEADFRLSEIWQNGEDVLLPSDPFPFHVFSLFRGKTTKSLRVFSSFSVKINLCFPND